MEHEKNNELGMEEFGFNTDDLVCELYQPKQKKPIPIVDYSPKIDSSLWFLNCDPSVIKLDDLVVVNNNNNNDNDTTQPRPSTALEPPAIVFKDSNIIYLLAQCYHRLGQFQEAIEQYHRAITYNQVVWEWWFNLAHCYLGRSMVDRSSIVKNTNMESYNITTASTTTGIKSILCGKRSITIALFHLMNSIIQKKSLDTKAGWQQPLVKVHESISQIYQSLIDYDIKDLLDQFNNNTNNTEQTMNDFELKWFIQYKDKENDETEQLEEENPYNL
ncbi:hypothetical protein PPL_01126 [Heterostelium album PN500]|uniref:Uncharacterized protein n=1 Tax=Heterostelium pallidum (strain ATCC 26659 / Pp 5 / PN500) TaxID=670386 RepID=D3AY67_HETP5|nr:hypothetical protein PPL_01126 [Heterostelium album PN500]EFA85894.1 hypothetical protein PPL_01126 [Heterostelium album PN500]|eukprot:XP_020438000.1 hypothetical protein PPL_01126 [Heterostelium album PN500]